MSDFWTSEKGYKIYKNGPIGKKVLEQKCPEDCVSVKMGDGTCDQECNTIACLWDGDDCDGVLPEGMAFQLYRGPRLGATPPISPIEMPKRWRKGQATDILSSD